MQQSLTEKRTIPFFIVASFVVIPAILIALYFFRIRYGAVMHGPGLKNKILVAAPFLLLVFILYCIAFSFKRFTTAGYLILASMCIYGFFVLKLTGYFDLSLRLAGHTWLHDLKQRIHTSERINLKPFKIFHIYEFASLQVIGNFIMLMPLGIYLGLLLKKASFIKVVALIVLVTVSIELMQLLSNYRSTDIDDVILNTLGGIAGWIIYYSLLRPLQVKKYLLQKKSALN